MNKKHSQGSVDILDDSIADYKTSPTRLDDVSCTINPLDSFILSPDRKVGRGDFLNASRGEFERDLKDFMSVLSSQRGGLNQSEMADNLNHLKQMVISLIKENTRLTTLIETIDGGSEGESPVELRQRVFHLESDRAMYEDKIKTHGIYIHELETKINQLIEEYIVVLERNDALTTQLNHVTKPGTTFSEVTRPALERLGNLIENEQSLYNENHKMKSELSVAKQKLRELEDIQQTFTFRDEKQGLSLERSKSNELPRNTTSPRVQINGQDYVSPAEAAEKLKRENEALLKRLEDQEILMRNMQSQNYDLQKENGMLKQSLKGLEEKFMCNSSHYIQQIETLANGLQDSEYNLSLVTEKCERLQKLVETKTELEVLLQSRSEIIQSLEEKLENLMSENEELVKINDDNFQIVEDLKSQLHESGLAKKAGKSSQVKKDAHNMSNENLEAQIQALASINAQLGKEIGLLKEDFIGHKKSAWNITKEMKKNLENYRTRDPEIMKKLNNLIGANNQDVLRLRELYILGRKDVEKIAELIEEKQKSLEK